MGLLKKLKIELQYDSEIPLLGIYMKSGYNKSTCTPMFIASTMHNSQALEIVKMPNY
jgi:hypothetical protein